MPLQKLLFNPGINKEGTAYTAEGGWFDGNLIRFRKGFPEKIGGWAKNTLNTYLGTARNPHSLGYPPSTKFFGIGNPFKTLYSRG